MVKSIEENQSQVRDVVFNGCVTALHVALESGSLVAVIHVEKDAVQRRYNWQILSYLLDPALLLSDDIVVKARRIENRPGA